MPLPTLGPAPLPFSDANDQHYINKSIGAGFPTLGPAPRAPEGGGSFGGTSAPVSSGGSLPSTHVPRATLAAPSAGGGTFGRPSPFFSGASLPFTQAPRTSAPRAAVGRPFSFGGGFAMPGTGLGLSGGSPSTASPLFGSTSGNQFWNSAMQYSSPLLQSRLGGSYQNPNYSNYFSSGYPSSYTGDPLLQLPWFGQGYTMPRWLGARR